MGISINAWLHDFHNFKMQNFMKERHLKNPGESIVCFSVLAIKADEKRCFEKNV